MNNTDARNMGHGHVTPRPDGYRSRCGGPAICVVCQAERAAFEAATQPPQDERGQWTALTDMDRERAMNSMPNMLEGFMKTWGWLHFAKAIEEICREKNFHVAKPAQPVALSTLTVTDAMVEAYLQANKTYWEESDQLPGRPDKWRNGTPREATRVSLEAALAASAPAQQAGHGDEQKLAIETLRRIRATLASGMEKAAMGAAILTLSEAAKYPESLLMEADGVDALLDDGWIWDGDQWQRALASTPPQPVAAEVATAPKLLLERAAQMCEWYAEFIRDNVMSQDIERHPYLPELEGVAVDLRALAGTGSDESKENGNG